MNICKWIWWDSRSCMSWRLQNWNSIFSHHTHAIARTMAKAMHKYHASPDIVQWDVLGSRQRSNMFKLWCCSDRIELLSLEHLLAASATSSHQSESESICSFNGGLSTISVGSEGTKLRETTRTYPTVSSKPLATLAWPDAFWYCYFCVCLLQWLHIFSGVS